MYLDNTCLFKDHLKSYTQALGAWYATFWVFSVEYPVALCNTCSFIERYCIGKQVTVSGVVKRLGAKVSGGAVNKRANSKSAK